jgi:endonuclease/exonuclease/phosphatase (EEP) superfamily protein YafD
MHRFTAMTLNIWNLQRWPAREAPLRRLLERGPDVLCVQELRPSLATLIDGALPEHRRVTDALTGWSHEGNIWWDTRHFSLVEYGAEHYAAIEPDRRMFWVRLLHQAAQQELVVASVHLTWLGGSDEVTTGNNPRLPQSQAVAAALDRIAGEGVCLIMGDFNDPAVPPRVLREAGLLDAWQELGVVPPPTFPAFDVNEEGSRRAPFVPPTTLDWQFHRGPVRPVMTETIDAPYRGVAPSDHRPLMTLYELATLPD